MPAPRVRSLTTGYKLVELRREAYKARAAELANQLWNGEVSITDWRKQMQRELKDLHTTSLIIARGGDPKAVSFSEWGRLGGYIRGQYRYLDNYQKVLEESAQGSLMGVVNFKSERYIANRSGLYGANARATFWRGCTYGLLPQVPGDGQTACGPGCGCELRIEEGDTPETAHVFWIVNPMLEHCPDCLELQVSWNPLVVTLPIDMIEAGDELGLSMISVIRQVLEEDMRIMHRAFDSGENTPCLSTHAH